MKTPAFPRPSAAARFALTLLALAVAAAPASSQTRGQRAYSPNNPLDMAQRELDKAETEAVRFDPQSPERKAVEGRAQQLRAQIAGSVLIYGAGINKPGLYPATPGLTLTEALKLAGGTTPDAEPAAQLAFASPHQGNLSGIRVNLSGRLEPEPPYDPATVPRRGQPGAGFGPPSAEYNYTISTGDSIRVDATELRFEGGTPKDFLKAIDAHYITDWQDLGNIPPVAAEIRVPKIKASLGENVPMRRGGVRFSVRPATALLDLYNALATDQPLRARSISLVGIPRERWADLNRELAELNDSAAALAAKVDPPGAPPRFIGSVQLSPGDGVLLVIGNMEYIELVDTFIGAKRYEAANTKNQ